MASYAILIVSMCLFCDVTTLPSSHTADLANTDRNRRDVGASGENQSDTVTENGEVAETNAVESETGTTPIGKCFKIPKLELPAFAKYSELKTAVTVETKSMVEAVKLFPTQPGGGQYWLINEGEEAYLKGIQTCATVGGVLVEITDIGQEYLKEKHPDSKVYITAERLSEGKGKGAAGEIHTTFFSQNNRPLIKIGYTGEGVSAPPVLAAGKCMVYDVAEAKFSAVSCTEPHTIICQPTTSLRQRMANNGTLSALQEVLSVLTSTKRQNTLWRDIIADIQEQDCSHATTTISFEVLLGLTLPWATDDVSMFPHLLPILREHLIFFLHYSDYQFVRLAETAVQGALNVCVCPMLNEAEQEMDETEGGKEYSDQLNGLITTPIIRELLLFVGTGLTALLFGFLVGCGATLFRYLRKNKGYIWEVLTEHQNQLKETIRRVEEIPLRWRYDETSSDESGPKNVHFAGQTPRLPRKKVQQNTHMDSNPALKI